MQPLNVRAEASAEAQVLATLSSGTQVDVLSTTGDGKWHEISYDGTKGFVAGDYLKVTEEKLYGQVVAGPLNVRSGPSADAEKVDSLSVGAIVEIEELIGGAGGWYQIEGGYVSSDYVAQVDAAVASASAFSAASWAFLAFSCIFMVLTFSAVAGTASFRGRRKLRA